MSSLSFKRRSRIAVSAIAAAGLSASLFTACGSSQVAAVTSGVLSSQDTPASQQDLYLPIYRGIPSAVPKGVQNGGPVTSIFVPNLLRIPIASVLSREILNTQDPYVNGVWVGSGTPDTRIERYSAFIFEATLILFQNTQLASMRALHTPYMQKYISLLLPFFPKDKTPAAWAKQWLSSTPTRWAFTNSGAGDNGGAWQAVLALNTSTTIRQSHWTVTVKGPEARISSCFVYPSYTQFTQSSFRSANPIPITDGTVSNITTTNVVIMPSGGGYSSVRPVLRLGTGSEAMFYDYSNACS